ncbi:MAG: hypothetical protein ABSB71_13585 [Candidatus Bathyarchaeia archaeon]|jgi:hypothetical protein
MAKISAKSENPNFFASTPYTYSISDSVALRIHSDTKPQNMKTASLQKGLILLYNGAEVVGEGTGFGVPIGKYSDETFFSGSSFLQVHKQENSVIIRKEFLMDMIARDKFRNLKLENMKLRRKIDSVSLLYQKHKRLAQFILHAKGLLFKFGVESVFIRTSPKGKVIVTYTIDRNRILVKLSFSRLDRNNLQKVFVLNEQGAHFFRKYSDSEGLKLDDEEIGAWDGVTAQSAKISDKKDRIAFSLKNVEGTMLRRGREMVKGSLNWIGLDYELNPEDDQFEYEIEIFA